MNDDTLIVDASRKLRIEGNAYDIYRVISTCNDALRRIEIEKRNPIDRIAVMVPGPDPTYETQRSR